MIVTFSFLFEFDLFCPGESSERHRGGLQKLLARLTVCQPREPGSWYQYGILLTSGAGASAEDLG